MALTPQQRQEYGEAYIRSAYQELLKRDPTAAEIAEAFPTMGGDKNIHDVASMRAFVAQKAQQEQNSPEKLYAKQREEWKAKAPENYGAIDQLFSQYLNRTATSEEKDHFAMLLASGQMDAYELGNQLKQLPEAVRKEDEAFRQQISGELATADQEYFQKNILPTVQSQFARAGRSLDSSAFSSAIANAAQNQNAERGKYLAGLSASQYAGRQGAARQDYERLLDNYYGIQNAGINAQYAGQQALTGRSNQYADYNMQQRVYEDFLRRYGKRKSGVGSLVGGIVGAGAGAYAGGPAGAQAGYGVGSGLGSFFDQ